MNFTFVEQTTGPSGSFGTMAIDGEHFAAYVTTPKARFSLPYGTYQMLPHDSPKHGATVAFHNPELGVYATVSMIPAGVTAHSDCLLHAANWASELLGCVAPGEVIALIEPNGMGVTSSRLKMQQLAERWGDRSGITATIEQAT